MRSLVLASLIFGSILVGIMVQSPTAHARRVDAAVDVCALRPDLCDDEPASARPARRATRVQRGAGRTTGVRGLDAESMSLSSVNQAPTRAVRRAPAAATTGVRTITCRPSTADLTAANQNLPECGRTGTRTGRDVASVNARQAALSFGSYMNQNATNPALSRKTISDYQTAFASTAKPATLDVTGLVDNSGVRETAPAQAAATPAISRNNQ